jgi:hypothetical protein
VLSVASLTPSPLITRVPQPSDLPPMVWRTAYSLDDLAGATARVIHDYFEPRRSARSRDTRVVLARDETASALSFGEVFYGQLVFNGKPAVENGKNYQEVTFAVGTLSEADIAGVADRLAQAEPTFVVLLAGSGVPVALVEALERRWPAQAPRPTYILPNDTLAAFAEYLGRSIERRRRFFAIQSDSSSAGNARFVMRYNDAHREHVGLTINPAASYDSFYLLAYATFALRGGAVTGTALARAFGRLVPPGDPIDVGPTRVFDALRLLAADRRIDLQGAASGLDFDLSTGEAPSDFAILCPAVGGRGVATGEDVESGAVFRARTRRIEGRIDCR